MFISAIIVIACIFLLIVVGVIYRAYDDSVVSRITIINLTSYDDGYISHLISRYIREGKKCLFDDLNVKIVEERRSPESNCRVFRIYKK
jgi:hypothetical protein